LNWPAQPCSQQVVVYLVAIATPAIEVPDSRHWAITMALKALEWVRLRRNGDDINMVHSVH
jgi:hypothetical protein